MLVTGNDLFRPVKVKSEKPGHLPVSLRLNDVRTQIFLCTGDSVPETTGITWSHEHNGVNSSRLSSGQRVAAS